MVFVRYNAMRCDAMRCFLDTPMQQIVELGMIERMARAR